MSESLAGTKTSLPARERGSKHDRPDPLRRDRRIAPRTGARIETGSWARPRWARPSLPARERGSKPPAPWWPDINWQSLPARERGSKQKRRRCRATSSYRSPHGSADRNVLGMARGIGWVRIAPRTGARIETATTATTCLSRRSLPARERGSKQRRNRDRDAGADRSPHGSADRNGRCGVGKRTNRVIAPRTGARIETTCAAPGRLVRRSLPARERGSRLASGRRDVKRKTHRSPHGSADRNRRLSVSRSVLAIAPRTGARIETSAVAGKHGTPCIAPRTGARIETTDPWSPAIASYHRSPHGSADRNVLPAV